MISKVHTLLLILCSPPYYLLSQATPTLLISTKVFYSHVLNPKLTSQESKIINSTEFKVKYLLAQTNYSLGEVPLLRIPSMISRQNILVTLRAGQNVDSMSKERAHPVSSAR